MKLKRDQECIFLLGDALKHFVKEQKIQIAVLARVLAKIVFHHLHRTGSIW